MQGKLPILEDQLVELAFKKTEEPGAKDIIDGVPSAFMQKKKDILEVKEKLKNPNKVSSFQEYIQLFLEDKGFPAEEELIQYGLERDLIRTIIFDPIYILEIPPLKIANLSKRLRLSLESAKLLIKRTCEIISIKPSTRGVMARYSPRNGLDEKDISMKRGVQELMLKASQRRPLKSDQSKIPPQLLEQFLLEFEKAYLEK